LNKESEKFSNIGEVIKKMGDDYPDYSDISLFKIGTQGMALNGKSI